MISTYNNYSGDNIFQVFIGIVYCWIAAIDCLNLSSNIIFL